MEVVIFLIIMGVVLWSFLGLLLLVCFNDEGRFPFWASGFEFVNPVYLYENSKLNAFGAILVSIFMGLICPIGTIIYWVYKLFTFG